MQRSPNETAPPLGASPRRLLRAFGASPALRAPLPASPGATPLGLRPHPIYRGPRKRGLNSAPGRGSTAQATNTGSGWPRSENRLSKKTGDGPRVEQPAQVCNALPSPPPLPAGKGSESPSVVKGAGGRPAALKPPTPMTRASIVPAASRAGLRPEILTRSDSLRSLSCGFRFHP